MIRDAVLAALMAEDDEHDKQLELYKSCGYAGVPAALLRLVGRALTVSMASGRAPSSCSEVALCILATGFSVVILWLSW